MSHNGGANNSKQKNRPSWNRNNSFPARQDDTKSSRSLQDLPPVCPTTRSKLNVFQYDGQAKAQRQNPTVEMSQQSENNKENDDVIIKIEGLTDSTKPLSKHESSQHEHGLKTTVPTTPAGRLALPDLIGMVDMQSVETEISPDERILWKHDGSDLASSLSPYADLRRNRKRPRSSSPLSSPAHVSAPFNGKAEPFDLKRLSQSLKTPQNDHSADIWDRHGADKSLQQGVSNSTLANIMYTSSPQSTKQGLLSRSEKGLKRSITCGEQWPKRPRILGPDNATVTDIFSETPAGGVSTLSRVSALLERVNEAYNNTQEAKSSSEPIASSRPAQLNTSPKHTASPPHQNSRRQTNLKKDILKSSNSHEDRKSLVMEDADHNMNMTPAKEEADHIDYINLDSSGSSDYGDFDDDVFDVNIAEAQLQGQPGPRAGTAENENNCHSRQGDEQSSSDPKLIVDQQDVDEDEDDEFGDMDDQDLEDMVAQYEDTKYEPDNGKIMQHDKRKVSHSEEMNNAESEDEFGDDFDDLDLAAVEAAATQSIQQSIVSTPSATQKVRAIQRYLVTTIVSSQYENSKGRMCPEKLLLVSIEAKQDVIKSICLRDGWFDTPVTEKAYVHVIGDFRKGRIIIDDAQHMLILHPDHLISSTVVADSFTCTRRAVLQDRVKATSDASQPLVYGTILHEIFQAAMLANRWDTEWLSDTIEAIATKHLEALYTIKLQINQAIEYLKSKMNELQSWAEIFVSAVPKPSAIIKAGNSSGKATMCVSKLLDVEEHVWSPMYGLKGNIDATVQVTMQEGKNIQTLTVPFEVKTGKNANTAHRAQTALYNLLLSDRYDIEIACGILYYMETSETIRIPAIRHEIRHMIMQRNELACFVRERHAQLPPMLKNTHVCKGCYAKVPCFIYHRLADDGDGESSGMKAKFDELVKHLTPKHKEFFLKWDNLLTKEEKESLKFRRELWTMLSSEREKLGRCFSNVIIEPGSASEEQNNPKINRFKYTLIKQDSLPGFSFADSQIIVGEPIVISDEKGHFALANGYVTNVKKHRITVAVDRRLHNARIRKPGFDETNNQVFASIMEVAGEGETIEPTSTKIAEAPILYRLDKDEFSNGMATVRNNLIQVMAEGPFGSREIRSLVVDLTPPRFKPHSTSYVLADRNNINVDQRRAIEKVMSAQDYALVLGMPGTGKTTTIAHIIRALVSQGKSVLLTSYTHTAVDNILLKLHNDGIPVLRLGAIAKVHPDVQRFATLAANPLDSFEDIKAAWHDSPVVATTCLGINHPIFSERTFDFCIVDEASQITLPVCLGPIRMARTFILVGDHYQLPPLVQNEEARTGGLDISLFKHLSDIHPSSVVNLEHQYRMCEDVMALSNNLIYSGRLKCGNAAVASRSVHIPNMAALQAHHFSASTLSRSQKSICLGAGHDRCWIRDMVEPSTKVRFINTDGLLPLSREESKGNRIVNRTEARIVTQLVESLLTVGVPANSVGVMTHYRSQLALLKDSLRTHKDIEMHTADRFQGRDKEVVILSLVRSNEAKSIGELLKDWRRINVAFTRAKTKLIVVGSRETLLGTDSEEMVAKFVELMEEKKWIYDLPKDALDKHLFEDTATQVSASNASRPSATQGKVQEPQRNLNLVDGKENLRQGPRKATIGGRALMAGKPVLRDIVNDMGVTDMED